MSTDAILDELHQPPSSNNPSKGVRRTMKNIKAYFGAGLGITVFAALTVLAGGLFLASLQIPAMINAKTIDNVGMESKEKELLGKIHRYCFPGRISYAVNGLDSTTCRLWLGEYVKTAGKI